MPREFKRTDRLADQLQRDLANIIRTEIKDPRVGMVTVNDVNVSKDFGYADVYVTLLTLDEVDEQSEPVQASLKVLNKAAGFLRSELGKGLKIRFVPQLRFHYDSSVNQGRKMSGLIDAARKKDQLLHNDDESES